MHLNSTWYWSVDHPSQPTDLRSFFIAAISCYLADLKFWTSLGSNRDGDPMETFPLVVSLPRLFGIFYVENFRTSRSVVNWNFGYLGWRLWGHNRAIKQVRGQDLKLLDFSPALPRLWSYIRCCCTSFRASPQRSLSSCNRKVCGVSHTFGKSTILW